MSLYIYSLSQTGFLAGCTWPAGLDDAPVAIVEHGPLAAVVSEISTLPVPVRRSDLQRHDAVNRVALDSGLCIPMRWGTMVADHPACVELLAGQSDRWHHAARRLQGRVELSVKVLLAPGHEPKIPAPGPAAHGPGTAYLRGRQAQMATQVAQEMEARQLGAALQQALEGLADAIAVTHRGSLVALAALVRREHFGSAVERLQPVLARSGGRWIVGEPWPPYSFVDEVA